MPLSLVYFMLLVLSAAASACPPAGPLADDATDAYLRVLRHLVIDKKLVAPDVAARVADAEGQINPIADESGRLNLTQAHVFGEAFAARLREGVDWNRVRSGAREIAAAAGVAAQDRKGAETTMSHLPGLGPIIPDFHRSIGVTPTRESVTVRSRRGRDGVSYLIETGGSEADAAAAFRIDNGVAKAFTLPMGTIHATFLESKTGTVYAAASTRSVTSVVDLTTGKSARLLPKLLEKDVVFLRDQSVGVISGAEVRFYPLAGGEPVTEKLPAGDFEHRPSEDGQTIYSYGFESSHLVVVNAKTGQRFHDIPFERRVGTMDTTVRFFQDAQGRPLLFARTKDDKTLVVDHAGAREIKIPGLPVILNSTLVKTPGNHSLWLVDSRDPSNGQSATYAFDPERPTPMRFPHPFGGSKSSRCEIEAGNGHPLSVFQHMDFPNGKKSNRIIINDLFDGTQTALEIDATKYHLFRGVTIGKDGAVNAIVSWPGGRGNARAFIQIYGPRTTP